VDVLEVLVGDGRFCVVGLNLVYSKRIAVEKVRLLTFFANGEYKLD
jgi:hypothetical protein